MRRNRGQIYLLTSLLILIVLIASLAVLSSTINYLERSKENAVINSLIGALKEAANAFLAKYSSSLFVANNPSFAKEEAIEALWEALREIEASFPETSLSLIDVSASASWYTRKGYSETNVTLALSGKALGVERMVFSFTSRLEAEFLGTLNGQMFVSVVRDGKPDLSLRARNFQLTALSNRSFSWSLPSPGEFEAFGGVYVFTPPEGVDPNNTLIKVGPDPLGGEAGGTVVISSRENYSWVFQWDPLLAGKDYYLPVEVLGDGRVRAIGSTFGPFAPLLPLPVRSLRLNATVGGVNREVPFQVEEWTPGYRTPLGLANNASYLRPTDIICFIANPNTTEVTLWWDPRDTAVSTPYSYENKYFTFSQVSPSPPVYTVSNGLLTLEVRVSDYVQIYAKMGSVNAQTQFVSINYRWSNAYGGPLFPVPVGPVRALIQIEPEFFGYNNYGFPNTFYLMTLALPANCTYYTYQIDLDFEDAAEIPEQRNITALTLLKTSVVWASVVWASPKAVYAKCGETSLHPATHSIDGDVTTYWQHPTTCYHRIIYDLGESITLSGIRVYQGSYPWGGTAGVEVYVSDDPGVWGSPVWSGSLYGSGWVYASFQAYGRYIMLRSKSSSSSQRLYEVQVRADSLGETSLLVENGIDANGMPVVSTSLGFYCNASGVWQHHWIQIYNGQSGFGVMFSDGDNRMLYAFDGIAGGATGGVLCDRDSTSQNINLCPVYTLPATFTYPLRLEYRGAIVVFNSADKMIYNPSTGGGLWLLVERGPVITG